MSRKVGFVAGLMLALSPALSLISSPASASASPMNDVNETVGTAGVVLDQTVGTGGTVLTGETDGLNHILGTLKAEY